MASILEKYSQVTLGDIFSDGSWVPIRDASLGWLDLPPDDFLEYARRASLSGDEEPLAGDAFQPGSTFLLAQAHRIWLTTQKIARHFPTGPEPVIVDLGAYPFTIDRVIRQYLKKGGRLLATVNQAVSVEQRSRLAELEIEMTAVNLDPLVAAGQTCPDMANRLPLADGSVDFVIFAHVIEHLYHPIQILKEAARVLKPGGRLLLTTDNAFLIGGLLSYLNESAFLHEPVEGSSAMVFHEWRGHVRFFSEGDLRSLMGAVGLSVVDCDLQEVMYNSIPEEFFTEPAVRIPKWRANLLTEFPFLRNEILMVGVKPATDGSIPTVNRPPSELMRQDAAQLLSAFDASQCDLRRSTVIDLAFGYRLLFGRWPTDSEVDAFRVSPTSRGLDGLVRELLRSPEFASRQIAVEVERPAHDCIVMTETAEGLRFFFSVQDTFVGFPVAVGVYEPDVQRALRMVVKPGMNCIDVGANLGFYSIHMGSIVREGGGRVFSFEPDEFAFGLLRKNCQENRLEEVVAPTQVACGEHDATARLFRDSNPANYGGMYVRDGGAPDGVVASGTQVSVRRLDDLIPQGVPIGFVKIDVEGYELAVIRGMKRLLQESAPVLICEFNASSLAAMGSDTAEQFLMELSSAGYAVFEAGAFGEGRAVRFDSRAGTAFANLVCLPEGTTPEMYFEL